MSASSSPPRVVCLCCVWPEGVKDNNNMAVQGTREQRYVGEKRETQINVAALSVFLSQQMGERHLRGTVNTSTRVSYPHNTTRAIVSQPLPRKRRHLCLRSVTQSEASSRKLINISTVDKFTVRSKSTTGCYSNGFIPLLRLNIRIRFRYQSMAAPFTSLPHGILTPFLNCWQAHTIALLK